MKNLKDPIELALFYLVAVALIARLNQILDNAQALADDTLALKLEATWPNKERPGRIRRLNDCGA